MKLSKRAFRLLVETGYNPEQNPAIAALVQFASQNAGLEPRNYFYDWRDLAGRRAYASEQRNISADFARFRDALTEAAAEGVTDADVIAEAPHAYSGRLEWRAQVGAVACPTCGEGAGKMHRAGCLGADGVTQGSWDYCTGQYFPTEYRKAAATLLEYATRKVRGSRPPARRMPRTIAELKALNKENGGCWFDPGSMRFFGTKIESGIIGGRYFITSEQAPHGPRMFSVRSFNDAGSVETVGEFNSYRSRRDAVEALREHMQSATAK